jgi:hypothetical protein
VWCPPARLPACLPACLALQGLRESALRKELIRNGPVVQAGLARLKKLYGAEEATGTARASGRAQEKARTRFLKYKNAWADGKA